MADESKAKSEDAKAEKAEKKSTPKKAKKRKRRSSAKTKPAKRAASKGKVNKSEFVRKHANLKPAQIVEKAKQAGIELTAQYASTIRSKVKKGKGSKGAGKRGRTRAVVGKRGKPPEKAQRVLDLRAQHPDWTLTKIAEEADCWPGYASKVIKEAGKSRPRSTKGAAARSTSANGDLAAFKRYAVSVGIGKAHELLDELLDQYR